MPINVPSLDDRDYADILRDALARIPVHNPEWTNFNDSDPGVTLIQLFAFMTESILYRANQIPERNRLKFLQLLGIPLAPAAAAEGFVTLTNERGPLESHTFDKGWDVRAGQVRFRTTEGLDVLPITAQLFYKRPLEITGKTENLLENYRMLYADLLGKVKIPAFYETTLMPQPEADGTLPALNLADSATTTDGCLWIALLARKATELATVRSHLLGKILTLGIMPHMDETGVSVAAGQTRRTEAQQEPVSWEIADAANSTPQYRPLEFQSSGSFLNAPGLVKLTLPATQAELTSWNFAEPELLGLEGIGEYPPSLADTDLNDRLITWIRLRLNKANPENKTTTTLKARLSWVGINATQVQQQVIVTGEVVGEGTGEPDQVFRLANAPVLPDSLELTVGGQRWHPINDLLAADPEVPVNNPRWPIYQAEALDGKITADLRTQVFTLDPESGQITFGDGAHGARPRQRIVASYAFGGGRQGNVSIGSINRSPQLPAGYKVTNPIRTWGGDDAQDTASAEKGVSRYVQHRDRLVSVQDFEEITRQTPGVDLGRVSVLPLFDPNYPTDPQNSTTTKTSRPTVAKIPGVVTVMVIPTSQPNRFPQPDQFFLEAVCNHLQPRRLVTTELHVRGPQYVDIWVSVGIEVQGGYAPETVREAVKDALYRFLSPLHGGHPEPDSQMGKGWPLNVPVLQAELAVIVSRVPGVRLVNSPLRLGYASIEKGGVVHNDDQPEVPLLGLQLPRMVGVSVVTGEAIPLKQLRNSPRAARTLKNGGEWVSIPVLPERC